MLTWHPTLRQPGIGVARLLHLWDRDLRLGQLLSAAGTHPSDAKLRSAKVAGGGGKATGGEGLRVHVARSVRLQGRSTTAGAGRKPTSGLK